MEDKHLSGEEKRRLMKEEFKKDLLQRKEFLQKVEQLKKQQTLRKAVEGMTSEDDTDEWVNLLNQETAFKEAKTEMALNLVEEQRKKIESLEHQIEMEKLSARQLVEQMKRELGLLPPEEEKKESTPEDKGSIPIETSESQPKDEDFSSESAKTMGDF